MKKHLFFFVISLVCIQLSAQDSLPYRAFESFKNDSVPTFSEEDTLAYLAYNFGTRADYYIGKTIGDMIDDLELEIQDFASTKCWYCEPNQSVIEGISFFIQLHNSKRGGSPQDFHIETRIDEDNYGFIPSSMLFDLKKNYPSTKWVPEHYEFFKNIKIKTIWIYPTIEDYHKRITWREKDINYIFEQKIAKDTEKIKNLLREKEYK